MPMYTFKEIRRVSPVTGNLETVVFEVDDRPCEDGEITVEFGKIYVKGAYGQPVVFADGELDEWRQAFLEDAIEAAASKADEDEDDTWEQMCRDNDLGPNW